MSLSRLQTILSRRTPFVDVQKLISGSARMVAVEEISPAVKPLLAACVSAHQSGPVCIIAYSEEEAEKLVDGLISFGVPDDRVCLIPPAEDTLFTDGAPDWTSIGARIKALSALALGKNPVVVMPVSAALLRTVRKTSFAASVSTIKTGDTVELLSLARKLAKSGYRREDLVLEQGQFSIRGGLLDIWPSTATLPVRIELFDDEVESIRPFEPETQRSEGSLASILLPPAREGLAGTDGERAADILQQHLDEQIEALRSAGKHADAEALELRVTNHIASLREHTAFDGLEYYTPYLEPDPVCLVNWLPDDTLVIWDEPAMSKTRFERLKEELAEINEARTGRGQALAMDREHHVSFDRGREEVLKRRTLFVSSLPHQSSWLKTPHSVAVPSSGMETFGSQVGVLADNIRKWLEHDYAIVIVTPQVLRMGQMLMELGLKNIRGDLQGDLEPGLWVLEGALETGFRIPDAGVIVVTDGDIFGATQHRRTRPSRKISRPIASISDIQEGDYIVHVHHGIGIYKGLRQMGGVNGAKDFLLLEYAGGDKLFVPADQTDRVQKYSGADAGPPTVHRLGGSDWARTKKKVKASVREMAKELLQVYAAREALGGYSFPPDTPWQAEMEQAFPYRETIDQERAIEEVKRDLEMPKPMDRVICGDVGFGKTEIAIRAAFKVVLDGKQVAVLSPTTVLAQQHFNVFSERLGAFPVKVEMLSRFRTAKEQKAILDDLKAGNIDIVIGTHRLLSKDVEFKELGLIIVDEEQRFGVSHKERLKHLRLNVDVLTLTATPIPRTLHMSLSGIRDMSVVNQAPEGRIPVRTYVRQFDDELVREAIVRELDRDGQVYFLHNRVESINSVAEKINQLVPYARTVIAHGQMGESELEQVMMDFYHNKYDILVCTTIIESGLDIPNANTIIINNSDKLGLSQLYQLRGRVGRSDRQAYAYLLYKSEDILTEVAEKRLGAIREFADLGSGFKIAMRDLEIRGAGNILGAEQHGQMLSVGFDMYCHLLAQAVKELKGEIASEEKSLPTMDLPVEAFIPESYIPNETMRVAIYRKMAAQFAEEDISRLEEELDDRFGPPPAPVRNALAVLRLKIQAQRIGIKSITEENGRLIVLFAAGVGILPEAIRPLKRAFPEHVWEATRVSLAMGKDNPVEMVSEFMRLIARSLSKPESRKMTGVR